jgi:putative transposase
VDLQNQTGAGIRQICRVLGLPRSGFYLAAQPSARSLADAYLGELIETIFRQHYRRYGHRRIWHELAARDVVCAPERVRRIMRQRGLRAIQPKNFVPKTSDGKASRPSPNLLACEPPPTKPNQVWTADFTYIPSASGWLYLALVMDLYSRRIVGWKLATHMRGELVLEAFEQALRSRPKTSGIIFHSDRGSQYASTAFRTALKAAKFRQSMSARSNPYDNAWTESVIGTIKREMLQNGSFDTLQDAQTEIFEYIEGYYNTSRRHSALGYSSPAQFESNYFTNH